MYGQYSKQSVTDEQRQQISGHKQKLVFIGLHLDGGGIQRVLDGCLLSEEETMLPKEYWNQWASLWDSL